MSAGQDQSARPSRVFLKRLRILGRLMSALGLFARSEVGLKARVMSLALVVFLFGINGLNVVLSYVGRDFMSAIENRNFPVFVRMAVIYVAVFAVITTVAVFYRFIEERLALLWRQWLTRRYLDLYLGDRAYQRISSSGTLPNPDQRIAEDVQTFTRISISFALLFLSGTITIVAFSGVLWSISRTLFLVAVAYALLGSVVTVLIGARLVGLNSAQFDKEANFRAQLVHIRENAEAVAVLHRERRLKGRLLRSLDDLVDNMKRIIAVNRNLSFFTTGYNYLIQIIPALIVAPMFIQGKVEFGVITQSGVAFAHLMGAFSLIVTQFQSISNYAAVVTRLDALEQATAAAREPQTGGIDVVEQPGRVAFERLCLVDPEDGSPLLTNLTLEIAKGSRVLICGKPGLAKVALFRATAGFWRSGSGRIIRPSFDDILFLPERPYLPPGTLRELMLRSAQDEIVPDEQIIRVMNELGLERVLARAGSLDSEQHWSETLSDAEQHLLAVARLLLGQPEFVFIDRLSSSLSREQAANVLRILDESPCTLIALGRAEDAEEHFDGVLEIRPGGSWLFRQQCPLNRRASNMPT